SQMETVHAFRVVKLRPNKSRTQGLNANVRFTELLVKRLSEEREKRFRCTVVNVPSTLKERRHRGNIDDSASVPLDYSRKHSAGQDHGSDDMDIDHVHDI